MKKGRKGNMNKNIKKLIGYFREGILSKEIIKTKGQEISLFCWQKEQKLVLLLDVVFNLVL